MSPNFSHSKIGCYEGCPRKFKFKYVDHIKLPKEPEGIEAFVGKRAHETLQQLYAEQLKGKVLSLDEMLAVYKQLWDKEYSDAVQIVKKEKTVQEYYESGANQLTGYYERFKPFNHTYTLGLEMEIKFDLDDKGVYKMKGFVDRFSYKGKGTYEIHDYKTGMKAYTQEEADEDRQLALYQIYVEQEYPEAKEVVLIWHFLADNKDVKSRRTKKQINELRTELLKSIHKIEADDNYKPNVSYLCDWCEYKDICPAKK